MVGSDIISFFRLNFIIVQSTLSLLSKATLKSKNINQNWKYSYDSMKLQTADFTIPIPKGSSQ